MSNLIFNLRIGKLSIQISEEYHNGLSYFIGFYINPIHSWTKWPIITLYQFGDWTYKFD